VKVRGTAAHIAEKYMTLARDAHAAGDPVSAENYLQHAEHYYRIVMAAQTQFQQQQPPQFREAAEEGYDDDRQMNGRPRDRFEYNGDGRGEGDESFEPGEGDDRGYQQARRPERPERPDDRERQRGPRPNRYETRERPDRDERQERNDPAAEPQPAIPEPAASAAVEEASDQPRRRRGRPRKTNEGAEADASDETSDGAAALAAFPE
jgi:hypothetical protein